MQPGQLLQAALLPKPELRGVCVRESRAQSLLRGRDQAVATVAATDPATTSSARSAAASSGGRQRSTQVGGYAPETRPSSRQHQLQPPKQAAPALHSAAAPAGSI